MLKIWGRVTSSNVQKVMWTVAELDLEHERIDAGGAFGAVDESWYRKMNPNGLVPTIEDDGQIIWESNTIVRYLAARYGAGRLTPEDLAERAQAERWMDWQLTTVGPDWGTMFMSLVRTPPSKRDPARIDSAVKRLEQTYRILDTQLEGRDYVMGDTLSIADIPLGVTLYRYRELVSKPPDLPNLLAWYERLKARPAYAKHAMISFESLRVTD